MSKMEDLMIRLELMALQDHYCSVIDNDQLENWPKLFVEDAFYEVISRENEEGGFPAPAIRCDSAAMLRDRVLSLRNANIFERPLYRHMISGLTWKAEENNSYRVNSSYVIINTNASGDSIVYQAGLYQDLVVRTAEGLRFKSKRCIYDTLRVQTLLAFPI